MADLSERPTTAPRARPRPRAEASITMRIPSQTRELIDAAATALGKSRTEFMLESARQHAVDTLLDRRVFNLDAAASEAFAQALTEPVEPNDALRALMASTPPWK